MIYQMLLDAYKPIVVPVKPPALAVEVNPASTPEATSVQVLPPSAE